MIEDREVTWFPSYGAEVRGGTANCTVILSDALIGSPVVTCPDILIVMNNASKNRFLPQLKKNGFFLFDSSLIREHISRNDIDIAGIPATDIANRIGHTKSANMVMLGGFIAKTGSVHRESSFQAVESLMQGKKKNLIEENQKAILEGIRYIENTEGKDTGS
jgi:2-oxoglutarate ferredoxin oxidoreductase subunit gamma